MKKVNTITWLGIFMKPEKFFVVFILLLLITSIAGLVYRISSFNQISWDPKLFIGQINQAAESIISSFDLPSPSPTPAQEFATKSTSTADKPSMTPTNNSLPLPTATPQVSKPRPTSPPQPTRISQSKSCYRATVTHLDGSTSNLCYQQSDYFQISSLNGQYQSAKAFYEFNLRSAQRYQEEYDRSGASLYLDAKSRAEADAQSEKQKMEQAVAQMQQIETRGW